MQFADPSPAWHGGAAAQGEDRPWSFARSENEGFGKAEPVRMAENTARLVLSLMQLLTRCLRSYEFVKFLWVIFVI